MNESKKDEILKRFKSMIESIQLSFKEFDEFIVAQPHIIRSIRGHAFEIWFDDLLMDAGYKIEKVGGDDIVDRKLNEITLQLKTPYWRGTVENKQVQFRMHKTHGREKHPEALYTRKGFADFFIGMHANGQVIICPKEKLPIRKEINPKLKWGEYVSDPMPFPWDTEWINRYDLIGVEKNKLNFSKSSHSKLLPKIADKTGFSDLEIIQAIISEENFRVWQQLIVGTVREWHFEKFMKNINLEVHDVDELSSREREKVDYTFKGKDGLVRIQVKGLTKGLCRGLILGCETQGSHSRIPIRLYRRSDFDVLCIVIDPYSITDDQAKEIGLDNGRYQFHFVKMADLPRHPRSDEWDEERIKSSYMFDISKTELSNVDILRSFKCS